MRTTLTLDDDLARKLTEEAHRRRTSFKEVVNETLRRGLAARPAKLPPYRYKAHVTALQPGIDPEGFNKLADELELEDAIARKTK